MAYNAQDAEAYFGDYKYDPYADNSALFSLIAPIFGEYGKSKTDAMSEQIGELNDFYGEKTDGSQWTYDDYLDYQDLMNNYNGKSNLLRFYNPDGMTNEYGTLSPQSKRGINAKAITPIGDFLLDRMDDTGRYASDFDTARQIMIDFGLNGSGGNKDNASVDYNDKVINMASTVARETYGMNYDDLNSKQKADVKNVVDAGIDDYLFRSGRSNVADTLFGGYNATDNGYGDQFKEQGLHLGLEALSLIPGVGPIGFATKGAMAAGRGAMALGKEVARGSAKKQGERILSKTGKGAVNEAKAARDSAVKALNEANRLGDADKVQEALKTLEEAESKLTTAQKAAASTSKTATEAAEATTKTASKTGAKAAAEAPVKETAENAAKNATENATKTAQKAATEGTKVSRGGSFKSKPNSSFKKGVRTVTGKHVKTSTPEHAKANTGKHAKANTGKTKSR